MLAHRIVISLYYNSNKNKNFIENLSNNNLSTCSVYSLFYEKPKKNIIIVDDIESLNNSDKIIIAEEDLIITNIKYIDNLYKCIDEYNIQSDYILHLGGFPGFTNNLYDIIKNDYDKIKLKSRIYLTTAYVVNLKTAIKLVEILNNSSKHIHCDAIFANSGIDQYLIKGNIVNQLEVFKSDNTYINNFFTTKMQTKIFIALNKISIFFINNNYTFLILSLIAIYKNNYLVILTEFILQISKLISRKILDKKYNKYLSKNIFTYLEIISLIRIYTIFKLL